MESISTTQERERSPHHLNLPYPQKMLVALRANARGDQVVFVMDDQI